MSSFELSEFAITQREAIGAHIGNLPQVHNDHSVYAPGQWATALQCNVDSHSLGTYISVIIDFKNTGDHV